MQKLILILTGMLCGTLMGCVSTNVGAAQIKTFQFADYSIEIARTGCSIRYATIQSKGPPQPSYTYHMLMIGARGVTSGVYGVNCPPLFAGGKAQCVVINQAGSLPYTSAGLGCGGWDQFVLKRI